MSNTQNKQSAPVRPPMGGPGRGPRMMGPRQPINKKTVLRLLTYLKPYWPRLILVLCCIVISAIASVSSATFLGRIIDNHITPMLAQALAGETVDYTGLIGTILQMAGLYVLAILASYCQMRIMAVVSHSILKNIRNQMFEHMQTLPIRYFDTNTHGAVMSYYTNDTDTLRQIVSQSLPQVFSSAISLVVVFISMMACSVWLTLIVILCAFLMMKVTAKIGGKSAGFFMAQQKSLASVNGYIEEMINGQKVVKVFNHEDNAKEEFDRRNDELCENATNANKFANILGPVNNNLGHIEYVVLAIIGGAMAIGGVTNLSLTSGFNVLTLGAIASFLTLSRNFMQPINQVAQQTG